MAIPAVTTAALLSAPLVVLLFVFGYMATSAPTELCLEGCVCYDDIQNKLKTVNCTSFRPVLTAASSLLSDFSQIDVLNVQDVVDGSSDYIIDGLFGVFSNVKYMSLINCSIFKIDSNAFKGLKRLEELDISKNRVFKFRSETFRETPKLKVLDLSFNPLRLGPTTFLHSKSLEDLILSSCNISSIPVGAFRGLPNLKTLDLYDNQMQSFTTRSFPRNLKHLWLTKNNLTNVPTEALSSLKKLISLDLSKNPINCTCSLMGLQDWFSSKGTLFENDVICRYPSNYEGESWKKVFENEVCFESEETNLISNKDDSSENSCENDICNESTVEDRYIYAVQADQAISDISTEVDVAGSTITILPQAKYENEATPDQFDENMFTTETSGDISDADESIDKFRSENLVKDSTILNVNLASTPEPDIIKSDSSKTPNSESSTDQVVRNENTQPNGDTPTGSEIIDQFENSSPLNLNLDESTIKSEIQTSLISEIPQITTLKSALSSPVQITTLSVLTTQEEQVMTTRTLPDESASLPEEKRSITSANKDAIFPGNPTPTSPLQGTISSTTVNNIDEITPVIGSSETFFPITNIPFFDVPDKNLFLTTSEIPTMSTANFLAPITSNTSSFENIKTFFETKESMDSSTTVKSSVETTNIIINTILTTEKTNYLLNSKKEILSEMSIENKTDATAILPRTDNEKTKILESKWNKVQKTETMGSYIVLAGIILVLLLLIFCTTTKKSENSTKKKIPLMHDTENNISELQEMATLLPSSSVVNDGKNNNKIDEPSATTKFLETRDVPDDEKIAYVYPEDDQIDRNHEPAHDNNKKCHGKSTFARTNGSSNGINGTPPLELTKAKILVINDSLPRTAIYIHKNVNS